MTAAERLNIRMRPCAVRGDEAADQAVDHVLVERTQVGQRQRRVGQPRAGGPQAFGQGAGQDSATAMKPRHVEHDHELGERARWAGRRHGTFSGKAEAGSLQRRASTYQPGHDATSRPSERALRPATGSGAAAEPDTRWPRGSGARRATRSGW